MSLAVQLAALREGAAVAAPDLRVVVGLSGPDTLDWLERLVSAPVKDLPAGCCRGATLMDGKGKLRADLRLIHTADEWLLEIPASHAAGLLRALDMYILRDKVTLADRTKSHGFIVLLGPKAEEALAACGWPRPQECGGDGAVAAADAGVLIMPSRLFGAPGFDLLLPAAARDPVRERLVAAGAVPAEPAALQIARIEHGVPWFAEDLADGVIPLEAGLDEQVSITKGCYPGQEVVARITNLGQVARKLVRLSAEWRGGQPPPLGPGAALTGTAERAGQEAGKLTSVAHDETRRRTVALGFVRRAFWAPGTPLAAGEVEVRVEGDARR